MCLSRVLDLGRVAAQIGQNHPKETAKLLHVDRFVGVYPMATVSLATGGAVRSVANNVVLTAMIAVPPR